MSEEKPTGIRSAISGWIKAALTSVVGLLSGAILMYLTPLVNNAIKPAKPLANFAAQANGMTVNFSNRSTGATQGWWDFGDGSALEPFDPKVEIVPHTYDKAGSYTVKLALQNLIGDESERDSPVTLDGGSAAVTPEIADFKLAALTPGEQAPAAYQLTGKVKAGNQCFLLYGDDRPLETLESAANVDRVLYFPGAGSYTIRLAAFNGKQLVEQKQTVFVRANATTDPLAKLLVTYQAVHVERVEKSFHIHCAWQPNIKDSMCPFRKERLADPDCKIVSAELETKIDPNGPVRDAKATVAPDGSKISLTGNLVQPTGMFAPKTAPPHWLGTVKVVMERRSPPKTFQRTDAMATVHLPSTTLLPLRPLGPAWDVIDKKVSLELWDGNSKAWEGSSASAPVPVTLNNQPYYVTAAPQQDGFVLKIDTQSNVAAPPVVPPAPIFSPAPVVTPGPLPTPVITPDPAPQYGPIRRTGFEFNPLAPLAPKK